MTAETMSAMTKSEVSFYRGLNAGGKLQPEDAAKVFAHIRILEDLLDEGDQMDAFGTEGWRHRAGCDE